jgi:hypothetical protein
MVVLVTGGRRFDQPAILHTALDGLLDQCKERHIDMKVIQGGARGADRFAWAWAQIHNIVCITVHANWIRDGKAAGPRRNQRMLDCHHPDICVAMPGGNGTADMVARCKQANIPILAGYIASNKHNGNEP